MIQSSGEQQNYWKVFNDRYYANESLDGQYEYIFNIGRSLFNTIPIQCRNITRDQTGYCPNNAINQTTHKCDADLIQDNGISFVYQTKRNLSDPNHEIIDG